MLQEKRKCTEAYTGDLQMKYLKISPKHIHIDSSLDLDFNIDSSFVFKEPEKKEVIVYIKQDKQPKGLF